RSVGHGIDVHSPLHLRDNERGGAQLAMGAVFEPEPAESSNCACRLIDGVITKVRHGRVRGNTRCHAAEAEAPLVPNIARVRRGSAYEDGARCAKRSPPDQVVRPFRASLLAGSEHKHEAGRLLEAARTPGRSYDHRRHSALHVACATPIETGTIELAVKGRML